MPAPRPVVAVAALVLTLACLGSSTALVWIKAAAAGAAPRGAAAGGPGRRWSGGRQLGNASGAPARETGPTGAPPPAERGPAHVSPNALVVGLLAVPVMLCAWQCYRKAAPSVARWLGRPARGGEAGRAAVAADEPPAGEPGTVVGLPLGQDLLDMLFPLVVVRHEPVCVVCLLPVECELPCRLLRCQHAFHPECIDGWWLRATDALLRCPTCRQPQAPERLPPGYSEDPICLAQQLSPRLQLPLGAEPSARSALTQ